MTSFKIIIIK